MVDIRTPQNTCQATFCGLATFFLLSVWPRANVILMNNPHRLRQYRDLVGLTQSQLAAQAGVSTWLVSMIENGHVGPGRGAIEKLIKVTNGWIKPGDFFAEGE